MKDICKRAVFPACLALLVSGLSAGRARAAAPTYAPDSISLTVINSSEIDLSWSSVTANPAVNGYEIDRESPVGGGFTTIVANTGPVGTAYRDAGLAPGATYNYRISAINSDGTGPASVYQAYAATYPIATPVSLPDAPYNLKATAASGSKINLSWTAPSSTVAGYKIVRNYSTIVVNTNSPATTYADTGLLSGVVYDYQVFAVNSAGTGNGSMHVQAATPSLPYAPENARAASGDGQATVSWLPPLYQSIGGVTGYVVSDINNASNSVSVASDTLSVVMAGLTNGVSYSFGVAALNLAGQGPAVNVSVIPMPGLAQAASSSAGASSSTIQSLKDQIASLTAILQKLIAQLNEKRAASGTGASSSEPAAATPAPAVVAARGYTRNLTIGSSGGDVLNLQKFLIESDVGPDARNLAALGAGGYFGVLTQKALAEYQESIGIEPASGFFGPATREYVNSLENQ